MRIIFSNYDSIDNPYYGGGGAIATHEITKRLAKKHKIKIICGAYKDCKDRVVDGIEYKHIGSRKTGPLLGQLIFSGLLWYYAVTEKFDLWVENFIPPHSTNFIPLFTKRPVIGIATILHARDFSQKYKLPFYLIENFGLKKYKYFIALTEEFKREILRKNPKAKIEVIPIGIEKRIFNLKTQEENFALFLGRLDVFHKGLDLLLEAWSRLINDSKDWETKLIIAGSGTNKDEQKLRALVKEYKLEKNVELRGKVSGKEKEYLLSHCLFTICPSRFESFGIVVLENLAIGKPIVCFDIEGFKWIPDDLCLKVASYDVTMLSDKIEEVLNNKSLRIWIRNNGRKFAKKFDWDSIALQYNNYILNLASRTNQ